MPRLAAIAAGLVALILAGLVVVFGLGWAGGDGGTYAPRKTLIGMRLDPASALFGDVVTASARVVVDRREIDPKSVSLDASFRPYQAFTTSRTVTDGIGRAAEITFAYRLQCVTGVCLRAMEREERGGRLRTVPISFAPATVKARTHDGERVTFKASWPALVVHSRLTAEDIGRETPRVAAFAAPPVGYSTSPDLLGWVLVGGAAAFVLAAGALVASVVAALRREKRLRLPPHLTPTERALALARHALSEGDVAGGRKALERLVSELDRGGHGELADAADRLAWSSGGPSVESLDELALSVRSSGNGR
jgi:hypothetical protein